MPGGSRGLFQAADPLPAGEDRPDQDVTLPAGPAGGPRTRRARTPRPGTWLLPGLVTLAVLLLPASARAATEAVTVGAALLGGLLTALTPCVYPIIPLAVGFMGSWGKVGRGRAALLSGAYVLGMVSIYSALGLAAGLSHSLFGGWAASPVFKLSAAGVLWVFGAGMLGVYAFRLPAALTNWAAGVGGGRPLGAVASGAVSGLLAAGCTGPVLGGILTYIGATQDLGSAMTIMVSFSLGLGLPFFLLGTVLPSLPRPGGWLLWIEAAMGVILIAAGATFAAGALRSLGVHIASGWLPFGLLLAGGGLASWLWAAPRERTPGGRRLTSFLVLLMASGLTTSATAWLFSQPPSRPSGWVTVRSESGFDEAFRIRFGGRPVVVDFHADWCPDCRALEAAVFSDPEVVRRLEQDFVALRVDASEGTGPVTAIARRFAVPGLPAVRFFARDGSERQDLRLDGPFSRETFLNHLGRLVSPAQSAADPVAGRPSDAELPPLHGSLRWNWPLERSRPGEGVTLQ